MESEEKEFATKSDLIELEHRTLRILINLIKYGFKGNHEYKQSSRIAFVSWLFSPNNNAVRASLLLSILTLFVAIKANNIITIQNKKIDTQNQLIESQRRASLNFELSEIQNIIYQELKTHIDKNNLPSSNLEKNTVSLSSMLKGRIIAISNSLQPYRQLNPAINKLEKESSVITGISNILTFNTRDFNTEQLLEVKSPERTQLLISLIQSGAEYSSFISQMNLDYISIENNYRFEDSYFGPLNTSNSSFKGTDIRNSTFELASLEDTDFRNATLYNLKFIQSNFTDNNTYMVPMTGTNFINSTISSDFEMTNLTQLKSVNSMFVNCEFNECMMVESSFEWCFFDISSINSNIDNVYFKNCIFYDTEFKSKDGAIFENCLFLTDEEIFEFERAEKDNYLFWTQFNDYERQIMFEKTKEMLK